jgi:hypothetical protein
MVVYRGRSTWSLDVLRQESLGSRERRATDCARCRDEQEQCGSRPPFGTHDWAAPFDKDVGWRAIAHGPAPIEGQGAPARPSLCAATSGGDVTLRFGGGIMVCEQERALVDPVRGFDDRTKHALGENLEVPLTGRSNYRLERHAGRGFDSPGKVSMTSIKRRPECAVPARVAQPHR